MSHTTLKAIEIEAPQGVLPNSVFEVEIKVPYDVVEATAPSEIGYLTYYADAQCKKDITLVRPFLNGVQYTVPSLKGIANDPTNCKQNVACVIQSDSPQCEAAGGGANMTVDTVITSITTPDENGCDIQSSDNLNPIPLCDCYESGAAPGCHFQFITANDFTKLVPGGASAVEKGKPDEEDNVVCEGFNNKNKCDRKSGGACLWKDGVCVENVGLGQPEHVWLGQPSFLGQPNYPQVSAANEAVVGADVIEQSNSGNGITDMPLASAAMMLLSLYYALKW